MQEDVKDKYNKLFASAFGARTQKTNSSTLNNPQSQDKPVIVIDEKNWFGNLTFVHKASIYSLGEIVALKSNEFSQTYNLAKTNHSGFDVMLSDGNTLRFSATSAFIRTKKVDKLSNALDFLSKKTFNQRVQKYIKQIEDKGFFQYHKYSIYENGDIKYKTKSVNIAEAGLQNNVQFGRKSSFGLNSYYTPDEIWVSQEIPGKFFLKNVCIKTKENRDVIFAILIKLAESKGGKVNFAKR